MDKRKCWKITKKIRAFRRKTKNLKWRSIKQQRLDMDVQKFINFQYSGHNEEFFSMVLGQLPGWKIALQP